MAEWVGCSISAAFVLRESRWEIPRCPLHVQKKNLANPGPRCGAHRGGPHGAVSIKRACLHGGAAGCSAAAPRRGEGVNRVSAPGARGRDIRLGKGWGRIKL